MGKKNRRRFAALVQEIAEERGIRIGFLVISDGDGTSGYSTYKNSEDAWESMSVLKDILDDLGADD